MLSYSNEEGATKDEKVRRKRIPKKKSSVVRPEEGVFLQILSLGDEENTHVRGWPNRGHNRVSVPLYDMHTRFLSRMSSLPTCNVNLLRVCGV